MGASPHPPCSDPPDFATVWNRLRRSTPLRSQQDLAAALGITPPTVSEAKKRGVFPLEWTYRLARLFQLRLDDLLHPPSSAVHEPCATFARSVIPKLQAADICHVPHIRPRVEAPGQLLPVADHRPPWPFAVDHLGRLGTPASMVLMPVFGNALWPQIQDGDLVLLDTTQRRAEAGRFFALVVATAIQVRLVEAHASGLRGRGNDGHTPEVPVDHPAIPVFGRVVWWCREPR